MAHGDYYNPADKIVYNGDLARADDLNAINTDVDVAFEQVATDLDTLETQQQDLAVLTEDWAIAPQGTNPDLLQPDEYSSKANAEESKAWASGVGGVDTEADGVTTITGSSREYAFEAEGYKDQTVADAAATAADVVQTGLDVDATNADAIQTGLDVIASGVSAGEAEDSNVEAEYWAGEAEAATATKVDRTSTTGSAILPGGTEAQRDIAPVEGYIRSNTDTGEVEWYDGTEWNYVSPFSRKNFFHNAALKINQTEAADGDDPDVDRPIDRWWATNDINAADMQTVLVTGPESSTAMGLIVSLDATPTGYEYAIPLGQNLPLEDVTELSSERTVTLSFYTLSSVAGNYAAAIHCRNSVDHRAMIKEFTINTASTWEKKEITFTIPNGYVGSAVDPLPAFSVHLGVIGGASTHKSVDTWHLNPTGGVISSATSTIWSATLAAEVKFAQPKLEIGSRSTRFEHTPPSFELARCQRFYQKMIVRFTATTYSGGYCGSTQITFPTTMRKAPFVFLSDPSSEFFSTNVTTELNDRISKFKDGFFFKFKQGTAAEGDTGVLQVTYEADASL